MAANPHTIPKRLTCKWRLGYFPSLNHVLTDGGQSKTDLRHLRMCHVRTRSKCEASSQNLTRKTSHMLNIPYNFLNGFELISKMTSGTSQLAEIRRSTEKSHVWIINVIQFAKKDSHLAIRSNAHYYTDLYVVHRHTDKKNNKQTQTYIFFNIYYQKVHCNNQPFFSKSASLLQIQSGPVFFEASW